MPDRMRRQHVFGAGGYPINSDRLMLTEPVPAHAHDFCEVAIICGGRADYRTRHGARVLGIGDVVAVRPGRWHAYTAVAELDVVNIYLGAELLSTELSWVLDDATLTNLLIGSGDLSVRLTDAATERVAGWSAALAESRARDSAGQEADRGRIGVAVPLQLRSLLGAVLAEFVGSRPIGSPGPAPAAVRQSLAAMAEQPAHPWTIDELARRAGVSASHLHHQFAAQLGTSPLQWLTQYRTEQMAVQLAAGSRTVAEIGRSVGWPDPNYAARRFRAAHHLTPTAYRARFSFEAGGDAATQDAE
ncbi:AraC-type DNA-binding protein [Microlunatus soli]|uniref:AraC-type DNA-binding protein n=2 Tax=Microlunatus soli TaxID=630515 RepID=A0A1H1QN75_9ACTN|nr:AraC-type DNA-binding protein [Microlunatus soli]